LTPAWERKPNRLALFLLQILDRIQSDSGHQNQAFDDELPIRRDIHNSKDSREAREDQNADDSALNLADAAEEGNTADDAGCNGIKFIAVAVISSRVRIEAV
jgi:hypothetical protein